MTVLFALALAAAPDTTGPPMKAWALCMSSYAEPLLRTQTTETIVNGSFIACAAEERAARRAYIHDFGPETGASAFVGVKRGVRDIMIRRIAQGKQLRGYR